MVIDIGNGELSTAGQSVVDEAPGGLRLKSGYYTTGGLTLGDYGGNPPANSDATYIQTGGTCIDTSYFTLANYSTFSEATISGGLLVVVNGPTYIGIRAAVR